VSGNFEKASAAVVLLAIPSEVIWSYLAGGVVFAIGLAAMFLRGDWQKARGFDKLILFGPLFYAAPVAAFGTEHFTLTEGIATVIPPWIPWHPFWTYLVGACFIAGALSVVTGIRARLAAGLLGLTFFLFVVLMHGPGWAQDPGNRFALTVALRELSFSGGALALTASLAGKLRERGADLLATISRYFVAIPVLFFSFEQFLHGDHVPGVPPDIRTKRNFWTVGRGANGPSDRWEAVDVFRCHRAHGFVRLVLCRQSSRDRFIRCHDVPIWQPVL